jgi:hypothetical protein
MGAWACAIAAGRDFSLPKVLIFVGIVALAGAFAWELFEYYFNLQGTPPDTLLDITLGLSGAYFVGVLYVLLRPRA